MANYKLKVSALEALKRLHQVRHVTAMQERAKISEAIALLQHQIEDTQQLIDQLGHERDLLWKQRPVEMSRTALFKLTGADAQVRRCQLDAIAALNHLHEAVEARELERDQVDEWAARVVRKQTNVTHVLKRLRRLRVAQAANQEETDIQEQYYARH